MRLCGECYMVIVGVILLKKMIYCETYELLSFFDGLRLEDDLVVEACKINRLANLLREEHIKCILDRIDLRKINMSMFTFRWRIVHILSIL